LARLTHDVNIRPGRFATLMLIGRNPRISQTALSQANGRDKSTLTPVLNDLVKRGLVRREVTPDDRRTYELTLTAAGQRMLQQLNACAVRHDRNLDRIIGRRDRERFLSILRRIETDLTVERTNGRPSRG
jgi:DNA-binding MarR family transcriptional regulator